MSEELWQAEAVALHACLVLLNHVLAVGLRIGGVGKEHAFVASSLFILADTAWLCLCSSFAFWLKVGSEVVGACSGR